MKKTILTTTIAFLLGVGTLQNAHADLKDGLVAHWSFDDCRATDNSGNGHDGTLNGNPQCVDGVKGKAFSFDGISDYINAGNSPLFNVNNHTITTWVKSSSESVSVIVGKVNPHVYESINLILNSKLHTSFATDYQVNQIIEGVKSPVDDKWHFVIMSYDGAYVKFYIDGILDSSYPRTGTVRTNDNELAIGRHGGDLNQRGDDFFFNGSIDDLRIYNRALTEAEVLELYNGVEPQTGIVDLNVTITKPSTIKATQKATYKINVVNNGKATATEMKVNFVVPGKTFVTVDIPQNCTASGRIVECTISDLAPKQKTAQSFSMTAWKKGALNIVGQASAAEDDVNLDDNEKSAVISVK